MNEPKRPFSPEVKSEAERWRRETFDPAAVQRPERKPFVTDVGIGIEQPTGDHARADVVAIEADLRDQHADPAASRRLRHRLAHQNSVEGRKVPKRLRQSSTISPTVA